MTSRIGKLAAIVLTVAAMTAPAAAFSEEGCTGGIRNNAFGDLQAVIIPVADIAGNDGWMPLSEAMALYDIDNSFEDVVMDGGGELTCTGTNSKGQTVIKTRLVGWFLDGVSDEIHTVGHLLYDKDEKLRPKIEGCYMALNRDVEASDGYTKYGLNPDPSKYSLGGVNPAGVDYGHDRSRIPLQNGKVDEAKPIAMRPDLAATLKPGDSVYMVSAARPFHKATLKGGFEPMMQKCGVLEVKPTGSGQPNQIVTTCDWFKGVSGSLLVMQDPAAPKGMLAAIGMQARGNERTMQDGTPIDGLAADARTNSAIALAFDEKYKRYDYTGDVLVAEVDGNAPNAVTTSGSK